MTGIIPALKCTVPGGGKNRGSRAILQCYGGGGAGCSQRRKEVTSSGGGWQEGEDRGLRGQSADMSLQEWLVLGGMGWKDVPAGLSPLNPPAYPEASAPNSTLSDPLTSNPIVI